MGRAAVSSRQHGEVPVVQVTVWLAWLLSELLGAILGLRTAECPRGWHLDGVEVSGRFSCLMDVSEARADDPHWVALDGRMWCGAGELGLYVDPRHAECQKMAVPFANIPGQR